MGAVVGIDLGTTNTVIATVQGGRVHVLADERGNRLLPSVVSFHPNGEVLVGNAAKARRLVDSKNTIASIKRLIGRPWDSDEIRLARSRFGFELREGPGQGALVVARGEAYTLPEISAFVLKRARQIAEAALGETVDRAVITVPAHFNELQRASTKVAGRVAGLEVLRILNEPTAAALAYGFGSTQNERVVVYDYGGGTFDCSLLELSGSLYEVLATAGDTFLGGDDIDSAIAERMCDAFLQQHRSDPRTDSQAYERLRSLAERLKIELSVNMEAQVELPDVAYGAGGAPLGLRFGMTQADLDALAGPFIDRTLQVTQDALNIARLSPTAFDRVVLVGGSTRMPLVKRRVEAFFGTPPLDRVNPDEVVAIGAAIQAAALSTAAGRSIPAPPQPGAPPPPERDRLSQTVSDEEVPTELRDMPRPERKLPSVRPGHQTLPSAQPQARRSTLRPVDQGGAPPPPPPGRPPPPPPPNRFGQTARTDEVPAAMRADPSLTHANTVPAANSPPRYADRSLHEPPSITGSARGGAYQEPRSITASSRAVPPAVQEPPSITGSSSPGARPPPPPLPWGELPSLISDSPSIASNISNTQPSPHTQPIPTLKREAGIRGAPPPVPSPRIVAPPTPFPGWNNVGPLPTDDISRIVPDAANASIARSSPVAPGLHVPSPYGQPAPPPPPPPRERSIALAPMQPMIEQSPPGLQPGFMPVGGADPNVVPVGDPSAAPQGEWPPRGAAPVLVDVTPRALVVEVVGGYTDTVIPRNARIPCEHTRNFATGRDLQTTVHVRVAQGEAQVFTQNTYLGELELSGLRPAPRGDVTLAVSFELDANGTLQVRATDTSTGREARAMMKLIAVAQTEEEIEEMIERSRSVSVTGG